MKTYKHSRKHAALCTAYRIFLASGRWASKATLYHVNSHLFFFKPSSERQYLLVLLYNFNTSKSDSQILM